MKRRVFICFICAAAVSLLCIGSYKAVKRFAKVSEQGDADAQFHLGLRYLKGEGVPQDSEKAVAWFAKAAEQG
ncbi:MAG TPA: sel1 repeat family protein, partial [Anaerohalosphaeraceae bacterium]|nr:sel1 repeat family protein [Anaerohalosphaeraceae bacterium]HRU15218.1 sel1 repeat family protein [Anaerohalosphaeraceae bacterium]